MKLLKEFQEFLMEYKVVGLAVAFIMGAAATSLVTSLVNNIIMPIIAVLQPGGDWQSSTFAVGPALFKIGAFAASLINFLIIAIVVFVIAKMVLKEDKVTKK
ncbi:Large-conductance mechanosensitive channel [Candidatus Bilamarchaeum dharawalense]|uniref:Large-conductance mechanosensitive channel n=1 Tax=Candidatus Bilamarchaeum dharawalense TaxID=2885759 RepID=A0A5E4LSM4_9ARCH|nr:Large-conductance mechanosensitive channel [Candidatus Bilamarchaeum dharawalense]